MLLELGIRLPACKGKPTEKLFIDGSKVRLSEIPKLMLIHDLLAVEVHSRGYYQDSR